MQRHGIDARVYAAGLDQRRQRGGRPQATARRVGQVQGLDAQAVAHEHSAPAALIDQAEGEHAGEAVEQAFSPLRPALEQHLGVARRGEDVAAPLELGVQLRVVVDAAVEGDGEAERLIAHGLTAALGEVDDRQAAVHESGAATQPQPRAVGPPRGQRGAHALERLAIGAPAGAQLDAEAAHLA
jgi:hypothetical protein